MMCLVKKRCPIFSLFWLRSNIFICICSNWSIAPKSCRAIPKMELFFFSFLYKKDMYNLLSCQPVCVRNQMVLGLWLLSFKNDQLNPATNRAAKLSHLNDYKIWHYLHVYVQNVQIQMALVAGVIGYFYKYILLMSRILWYISFLELLQRK